MHRHRGPSKSERNDSNCSLLPVTMAVSYFSSLNLLALPLLFTLPIALFLCPLSLPVSFSLSHSAETRMIDVYCIFGVFARVSLSLCMCECIESTLNTVRVHLAELSSVVLCTSSTATRAYSIHIYFAFTVRKENTNHDQQTINVPSNSDIQILVRLELHV